MRSGIGRWGSTGCDRRNGEGLKRTEVTRLIIQEETTLSLSA